MKVLECLSAPVIVHLRESELHDRRSRTSDLSLVSFRLRHREQPLGLTASPQMKLRAHEMRFDAPRMLHCFDVLVIGREAEPVL
jgi:hypothetical protein